MKHGDGFTIRKTTIVAQPQAVGTQSIALILLRAPKTVAMKVSMDQRPTKAHMEFSKLKEVYD
jgi:hypothetical protein